MSQPIAFLSGGTIHVLDDSGRGEPVHSPFAEDYRNRAVSIQRRNEWKSAGTSAAFQRGGLPEGLMERAINADIAVTDVAREGDTSSLLFTLRAERVTGIFRVDPSTGKETRLFHSNEHQVTSVAARPDGSDEVACSLRSDNGTACLALIDTEKGGLRELTEGDSLDEAPSWTRDGASSLLYQSAGIARDDNGFVRAYGPRSVQCLNLASGALDELLADEAFDFLTPKRNEAGELYAIRRPWQPVKPVSAWQVLRGILLLPFHIVMAIFHMVNQFTRWYSKKPLMEDTGPQQRERDERLSLWGEIVVMGDRVKGKRAHANADDPLVPATWSLIRRRPDGETETVAKHVLCFDLDPDGQPVWSDGRRVWRLDRDGRAVKLGKGKQITQIAAFGTT